jgi:hypothetical protein
MEQFYTLIFYYHQVNSTKIIEDIFKKLNIKIDLISSYEAYSWININVCSKIFFKHKAYDN